MNNLASIKRSRGAVCGVALILLGIWGGLAPFAGPYFHFGYTPDKTWAYSTGRLYFSIIPGAAALLGGLIVVATRHRSVGVIGGLLGALGGLWFIIGSGVTAFLLKQGGISTGVPIGSSVGATTYTAKEYIEVLALFGAVGALTIFFGALACGRMSLVTAGDVAASEGSAYYSADQVEYPTASGTIPAGAEYSTPSTGSFPTVSGSFPSPRGRFIRPSAFRRAPEEFGGSTT